MMRVPARLLASALGLLALSFCSYAEPLADSLRFYSSASKDCAAALQKSAALADAGKWRSAFGALEDYDATNADPYALAMKTSLVLRGAVRTDRHRAFGLADIVEGQTLESLRQGAGDYEEIPLDPPALAAAQAAAGVAKPGILAKELGDYYCDVIARFSGQWFLADDQVVARAIDEYRAAFDLGAYDAASLRNYAEALVRGDRAEESEPIYRKAIELDGGDAELRFSFAMSLVYRGKKAAALPEIDAAIAAYGGDSDKINAIALGARTAASLGDAARAEGYYASAEKAFPHTATAGILRHMIAVESKDAVAAADAADATVAAYGSNPNVVRALVSAWVATGDSAAARAFLERNIAKDGDDLTIGALEFYLAVLLAQGSPSPADRAAALGALDAAASRLKRGIGEGGQDNGVFGVIESLRRSLGADDEPAAE
jgi:Uncharacterized protein conserved in bacteria containing a divergent form of TPR repeats